MLRTLIWTAVGEVCGLLVLAGLGAWAGFTYGGSFAFSPNRPPGWVAACRGAFGYCAYFWWLFAGVGGLVGGLTGLGSWLVRPRRGWTPGGARR